MAKNKLTFFFQKCIQFWYSHHIRCYVQDSPFPVVLAHPLWIMGNELKCQDDVLFCIIFCIILHRSNVKVEKVFEKCHEHFCHCFEMLSWASLANYSHSMSKSQLAQCLTFFNISRQDHLKTRSITLCQGIKKSEITS